MPKPSRSSARSPETIDSRWSRTARRTSNARSSLAPRLRATSARSSSPARSGSESPIRGSSRSRSSGSARTQTRRSWLATRWHAMSRARTLPASARSGSIDASGPARKDPHPTRGSNPSASFPLRSPRWRLPPLLLQARPHLVRGQLEVRRGHEHHVQKVGQLAERTLASLRAQGSGRLVRFLDELRRDHVRAALEQLRRVGALGEIAPPLPQNRGELREETSEVAVVHRTEARRVAGVTRRSSGVHLYEEGIGVAVRHEADEMHDVAARLSLLPEPAPRAAVEVHLARAQRGVQRFAVHVGEHQHRAGRGVLHDRGDEATLVERDVLHLASALGRTWTPRAARSCLRTPTAISPEWKIEAASPASAPVRANRSTKCAASPAPPEAIIGTRTASAMSAVSSRSKPSRVPSRSIDVSRISPAPCSTPRRAHSTASRPVGVRPPSITTSYEPSSRRRASMASTAAWAPARAAISPRSSGRRTAAVFMATLSAPARRMAAASKAESIPPPTQNGMERASATRAARSTTVPRRSADAVMSRKTSSSAPSRS